MMFTLALCTSLFASAAIDAKAEQIVASMTPSQRLQLVRGQTGVPLRNGTQTGAIGSAGYVPGLAPLGVGWVIWRDAAELPDDLVFHVNYLGGDMPDFQINFSRPAGQIIAQYYNFLRLGRDGITDDQVAALTEIGDRITETERRAQQAQRQLDQLGKVNPLALEEFAALEERYNFLSTQLEDVKAARKDPIEALAYE